MPPPKSFSPAPRLPTLEGLPLHTRSLTVAVKRLSERLWQARGDVIDLRKNGFVPSNHDLQPSGVIHMMSIELDFDPDTLTIEEIRIDQPFVAVEASKATKGECCRDPAPRLLDLRGEKLDPGFAKKLGILFGGAIGCSHLLTLFQLMASTLPRAVELERARSERENSIPELGARFFRRSVFIDGHERSAELLDVVIQLADTHARPLIAGSRVTERLALSHEVKTFASIDRKRFTLVRLEIRERERNHEDVGHAQWIDRTELVSSLTGARIIPGMAGRVFKLLGGETRYRPILDNLLMFAPAFLQVTAALMDEYFENREKAGNRKAGIKPAVTDLGGNSDSCYMWRSGGPIQRAWASGRTGETKT
ncbi:MAG: DUF2889 domain-containing protein [bacterium]|nr:hypothetical protein [Deltaproteobacteria bacterium]MCP4904621.1 DUF2889 domain-containing protein [bacterium]